MTMGGGGQEAFRFSNVFQLPWDKFSICLWSMWISGEVRSGEWQGAHTPFETPSLEPP